MSKNIIFISEQLFKERTGASSQIDSKQIVPMIKVAQDMHIQPALGSTLYKRLQDGIDANNLNANEVTLLDDYITDALVWFTMSLLPMTLGFQLFSKGFLQKTSEESQTPSRADLELIEQKYISMAEFYKTRLIKYLQENESQFTQYQNWVGTIDSIAPEKKSYSCPIYLGGGIIGGDEYTQYISSCGGGGGNTGGGTGGCGDCPIYVDSNYFEGDGTSSSPLLLSENFLQKIPTGLNIPTPIVTIDYKENQNVNNEICVHFVDNGFDFLSASNPEIFLFRWKNNRNAKRKDGSTRKKRAKWVHPNTQNSTTKWAGWKFFSGVQYMHNANGVPSEFDSRVTEWLIPTTTKPYERISIPFNRYMFQSEVDSSNLYKHLSVDGNVLIGTNGYKIKDRVNQTDNTKSYRLTGQRKQIDNVFPKVNTFCFALAIDNPNATKQNGLCPKIFSAFSNPFHAIWEVNNVGWGSDIVLVYGIHNRLSRVVRENHF